MKEVLILHSWRNLLRLLHLRWYPLRCAICSLVQVITMWHDFTFCIRVVILAGTQLVPVDPIDLDYEQGMYHSCKNC
jgi:hypothetical protein